MRLTTDDAWLAVGLVLSAIVVAIIWIVDLLAPRRDEWAEWARALWQRS